MRTLCLVFVVILSLGCQAQEQLVGTWWISGTPRLQEYSAQGVVTLFRCDRRGFAYEMARGRYRLIQDQLEINYPGQDPQTRTLRFEDPDRIHLGPTGGPHLLRVGPIRQEEGGLRWTGLADPTQGRHAITLKLPDSLRRRRSELETALLDGQRRLMDFARQHGWESLALESFADSAEIYDDKAEYDKRLRELTEMPDSFEIPKTYTAALEKRVLLMVSPELYREAFPEGVEPDYYAKLVCHEMAHRLQIRILDGNEEAMGPIWFFEGFAVQAADQFSADTEALSPKQVWELVKEEKRGSYRLYKQMMTFFLKDHPLPEMVKRAGSSDFLDYLKK